VPVPKTPEGVYRDRTRGTWYFKATVGQDAATGVGDVWVLGAKINSSSVTVSSISGGGPTTWTKLVGDYDSSRGRDTELWMGTITSTSSSTITVSYSGSVSGDSVDLDAQEFTNGTGSSTTWTKDVAGYSQNDSSTTTVTYPSLTSSGTGELYVGFARLAGAEGGTVSTSGFTNDTDSGGGSYVFDTDASGTVSPAETTSSADPSLTVAALIEASASTGSGPTVTKVSPSAGSPSGGASVSITGTNFTGATAVKFGSIDATSYTVNSATFITATAPANSAGTVDVTVTVRYLRPRPPSTSMTQTVNSSAKPRPMRPWQGWLVPHRAALG
jgi:IPT/TIG domain